jgi:serine/threonine-protein kinase
MTVTDIHLIANRYALLDRAERGSLSYVYRARDVESDRIVALKVLQDRFAEDRLMRSQFVQGARAGAAIHDPHVVSVSDLGSHEGRLFLVMPWIDGTTLKAMLRERRTLPLEEALAVTHDMLSGLSAMHRVGWIHADIKPENVLLDAEHRATIIDLGSAWRRGESHPSSSSFVIGSPSYMAPEQIRGGDLCPATDLYAVGIVLYRMLTGQLPFRKANWEEVLSQQMHELPEPPSALNSQIPSGLEGSILRALQKEPKERFTTAEEMAEAFEVATIAPVS